MILCFVLRRLRAVGLISPPCYKVTLVAVHALVVRVPPSRRVCCVSAVQRPLAFVLRTHNTHGIVFGPRCPCRASAARLRLHRLSRRCSLGCASKRHAPNGALPSVGQAVCPRSHRLSRRCVLGRAIKSPSPVSAKPPLRSRLSPPKPRWLAH